METEDIIAYRKGGVRKNIGGFPRILAWAPSYSFGGNKERGTGLGLGRKVRFLTQIV